MKLFHKLSKIFLLAACGTLLCAAVACQKDTGNTAVEETTTEAATQEATTEAEDYSTGKYTGTVVAKDDNTITIETEDGSQTTFTFVDAEVDEGATEIGALVEVSISVDIESYADDIIPADQVTLIEGN